jgi:hypothetical protein
MGLPKKRGLATGIFLGTYLTACIEIDQSDQSPPFSDLWSVHSLTEGSFAFFKDYDVFDALAGGREAVMAPEDQRHDPQRVRLVVWFS